MTLDDFNAIYCIHLAESRDRVASFTNEFNKVGILDRVKIWWTVKREISNKIGDFLTEMHTPDYDKLVKNNNYKTLYGGVFNCTLEHYTIIKQAYLRGFDHIMIFEDDVTFDGDDVWFRNVIAKIPDDFEICKFHYSYDSNESIPSFDEDIFIPELKAYSTLAYCMSRGGMKGYIDAVDNTYLCADLNFINVHTDDNKFYVNKYKICKPNKKFGTTIK